MTIHSMHLLVLGSVLNNDSSNVTISGPPLCRSTQKLLCSFLITNLMTQYWLTRPPRHSIISWWININRTTQH